MQSRRGRVDGGANFSTVNLAERRQSLLVEYIDVLRKVIGMVKERHPSASAMVIQVHRAADWPYSSIHRHIEVGVIGRDWGAGMCENDERGYGERE